MIDMMFYLEAACIYAGATENEVCARLAQIAAERGASPETWLIHCHYAAKNAAESKGTLMELLNPA